MEKVKDFPHLMKDTVNGGVINTDRNAFAEYKKVKEAKLAQQRENESLRDELNNMKREMSEIKELLLKIASK